MSTLKSSPVLTTNCPKGLLRISSRSILRHNFYQQLLQHRQRFLRMGSINCKEYVTNNENCAKQEQENGEFFFTELIIKFYIYYFYIFLMLLLAYIHI